MLSRSERSIFKKDSDMGQNVQTPFNRLICGTTYSVLHPERFFVAWSGALTLAYAGFPPPLEALKQQLGCIGSLPNENPGSRWPKTSLGCLRDGVRLTPEQLDTLTRICSSVPPAVPHRQRASCHTTPHRQASEAFPQARSSVDRAVLVDSLSVVVYECRSLERRLSSQRLPLVPERCLAGPSTEECSRVAMVLAEGNDPVAYWFNASKDGSREAHYRGNALGVTLVHDLSCFSPDDGPGSEHGDAPWGSELPGIVRALRQLIDQELPGLYAWFEDNSLHITIRAMI